MWYHLLLPFAFSTVFILHFSQQPLKFVLLLIGICFGFCFIMIDRFLHAMYVEPDSEFSKKVQHSVSTKNIRSLFTLLFRESSAEQSHLISRSTIFMICFMAIAIYVVTSTTNTLGIGLVLGIGLHYCLDLLLYHVSAEALTEQFFWQINHKLTPIQIKLIIGGFIFYFMMLTLLALR